MPTEWGTPIHRPAARARRRLRGAHPQGRRHAAGQDRHHRIRQPASRPDPQSARPPRTPGGSSSGSAAAVADFMVPLALGTQTTGSTIRPASFCGVFGYRPTWGEHRLHGVMEASGSLDTLGILARSVEDVALYRDVLLGIPPEPVAELDRAPRIGSAGPTSGTSSSRPRERWSRTRRPRSRAPARVSASSSCLPTSRGSTRRTAGSPASSSPAPSPGRSSITGTRSATRCAAAASRTASAATSTAMSHRSGCRSVPHRGSTTSGATSTCCSPPARSAKRRSVSGVRGRADVPALDHPARAGHHAAGVQGARRPADRRAAAWPDATTTATCSPARNGRTAS